jgi:Uma2 family endonuclease
MLHFMFDPSLLDPPERIRKLSRAELDRLVGLGLSQGELLSRVEFDKLVDLGAFDDERVELLRGQLVTMSPQGGPHAAVTSWLAQELIRALDRTFDVRSHSSFAATDDSEPEPDVSVVRRAPGNRQHPESALLLIEVSMSSLRKDRFVKAPIYGEAHVPEYWIVDISGDDIVVHVHTRPARDGYQHIEVLRAGDVLRPTQLPGIEIAVADIP